MAICSARKLSLGSSLRNCVPAVRGLSLSCMLTWALAAAFLCPLASQAMAAPATAATGSGGFALELKLKPGDDALKKVSLSRRVGPVSFSLQHELGGALEFKVGASLSEKWRHYRQSGSLTLSGNLDAQSPGARWSQISISAGSRADKKVIPWQPESKLDMSVRQYPFNPARDYAQAQLTAKGQRAFEGKMKPSIKGELSVGHKEMPGQPKWTADFRASSVTLQWRPADSVKAEASLSARQREYPEAAHKSYIACTGKASAMWAVSKLHSLDFAASASSTARPNDPPKDRATKDASVKWTWKAMLPGPEPAPGPGALTLTARAAAGTTSRPNAPADNTAWRAGASAGLAWELSKVMKLTLAAETDWSLNAWDEEGDDDEDNDGNGSDRGAGDEGTQGSMGPAGKRVHRLTLAATAGPFGGVTLSGKAAATRTDELNEKLWKSGNWEPCMELKASYKF